MPNDTLSLTAEAGDLRATVVFDAAMNYALAHNGISPLRSLFIENRSSEPLRELQMEIQLSGSVAGRVAEPLQSAVPEVEGEGSLALDNLRGVPWNFDAGKFAELDEAVAGSVSFRLFDATRTLRDEGPMRLLAREEWWMNAPQESLVAFVTPRSPAVRDLIGEASDFLGRRTGDPSIQGYQGGADRGLAIAEAIYDAMKAREIRYINPPASFEGTGQKIRPAHEVLVDRWGTCLDLATTHAAALEHAGLHPVIVLCEGHAFSGHLLDEGQLPELVLRDPRQILNYVEAGLFIPVETTSLRVGDAGKSFAEARQDTRDRGWWSHRSEEVQCLIDVTAAHRAVRPLPAVSVENGVRIVEVEGVARPVAPVVRHTPTAPTPTSRGGDRQQRTYPPRVDRWRSSLLDLSFRNPLLNMRTGRTSLDLHVPHGALGTLEDMLFDGRSISLLPHDQIAEIHLQRGARTAQDIDAEELRSVLVEDAAVFAACTGSSYLSRLRNIQRRARTVSEETGTNNLFVSLATLEWEDAGRQARAPLFLLPVTLQTYRGRPFTMQIEQGGYAEPNQCLLEKLRIGHGLSIPAFRDPETDASGIDLAGSLQAIRLALLDARLPFTIEESAHLSLLQFSTLQLWQDLSDNWETFLRNPVVRHLVETPTDSFTDPAAGVPLPPDPEARTYCPIAVDGSQLEAVDWAEAGRSFVLEGPPGTGKSQTITNLIANALAAGKTILFVAEKQAALDVVRRRLDKVGLGELCLDLHGKDQTPENMRKQLRLALHLEHSGNAASWAELRARHQGSVDSLGRYPSALHEPGGAGLSAWTARQSLLTAGEGPTVEIPPTVVAQQLDTETLFRVARELTQALYDLGAAVNAHPWRLAQLERLEEDGLRARVREAVAALYEASGALAEGPVADLLGSDGSPDALAIVGDWLEAITQIGWSPDAATVVAASQPEWRSRLDAARRALAAVRADSSSLLATFTPEVITEVDIDALLIRGKAADAKIFKGKARKAVAADLASSLRPDAPVDPKTVTPTLEALLALRSSAREMSREAQGLPGLDLPDWNPLADDAPSALEARVAVIEKSVQLVEKLPAASEVLGHAPSGSFSEPATEQVQRLGEAWGALTSLLGASARAIDAWRGTQRPLLAAIRTALPAWNVDAQTGGLVQLSRWCQVQAHLAAFTAAGLDGLVAEITAGTLHPDEIEPVLRRSIARAALEERVSSTILAGFDGLARDRAIERFSSGADEMRRDMVTELPAKIVSQRSFSPERLVGKVGQLSRELTRKRGGEKIRGLFENYGPIIGELTPCLMMSPHSVARFLPPDALDIDLVVFDEASQIKVAESISAMGRAKATVVVGDSQQMPPTNVAAVGSASEEEEGQGPLSIPSDMESVLSEAVESNLPRLWLSWHYRSQHESLISFSNHQYYEGRLASFPRPPEARSDLGVSWRRVDGTFERGRERVNRVEASTIVAEIRARLTAAADASIGVVTFNTQQRDLILDLLEECGDARVATALAADQESLFVKNLENVQGDERDVILFSLAFSRNPETGKLPLNFGPLLQAGGERRLNVAVTRARAQVVLFSSFDPHDIDLSRSSSVGLAHLRSYMEMAQREAGDPGLLRPQAARDHHHEDVVEALEAAGLHVREHVGQSDFAVDIGVAAAPEGPWVAVFLDGPGYAKRATVGDRESLPHGVLVGSMGWARVERVWLPDWVRDRAEVVQRIVRAAREPAPVEPAVVPEPSSPLPALRDSFAELQAVSSSTGAPSSPRALMEAGTQANAGRSQPELPVFTPAHDHLVGFRDQLDSITFDAHSRVAVYAEVQDIIAHEGPVETTRLARLACRRFDLHRVAPQRVSDVVGLIPPGQLDHTPFGTFAWPEGQDRTAYRDFRLAPADGARIVEEVAPQEIINSMSYLARVGGGISREELLRETALLFGVRRLTAKVRWHLEAVLDFAVEHLLLHDDGRSITSIAAGPA